MKCKFVYTCTLREHRVSEREGCGCAGGLGSQGREKKKTTTNVFQMRDQTFTCHFHTVTFLREFKGDWIKTQWSAHAGCAKGLAGGWECSN